MVCPYKGKRSKNALYTLKRMASGIRDNTDLEQEWYSVLDIWKKEGREYICLYVYKLSLEDY